MIVPDKCSYQKTYNDNSTKRPLEYECSRSALDGEIYCELHSAESWKSDPDAVNAALKDEICKSYDAVGPTLLVGFHLPDVDLAERRFYKSVYFQHTVFHGRANFENSSFDKDVSFRECVFERPALFTQTRFSEHANFFAVNAEQSVSFENAEFLKLADMSNCHMRDGDFQHAKFSEVQIRVSEFKGRTQFDEAQFRGHCHLIESTFSDHASFRSARFATAAFSRVKFDKADFGNVAFDRPQDIHFNSDLTNISFLGTDLLRVRFGSDTVWNGEYTASGLRRLKQLVGKTPNTDADLAPYDVREFEKNHQGVRLVDVLSVLRELRDNYEYRLDYKSAGKFFVQEMEIRRQYKAVGKGSRLRPWCWRWFSPLSFYRHLCVYGESFHRPAMLLAALACVAFLVFYCIDDASAFVGTCAPGDTDRWLYALTRTLSGLLQLGCQALPDYVLRVASIPILGTMLVALRRRFERRFRH